MTDGSSCGQARTLPRERRNLMRREQLRPQRPAAQQGKTVLGTLAPPTCRQPKFKSLVFHNGEPTARFRHSATHLGPH